MFSLMIWGTNLISMWFLKICKTNKTIILAQEWPRASVRVLGFVFLLLPAQSVPSKGKKAKYPCVLAALVRERTCKSAGVKGRERLRAYRN